SFSRYNNSITTRVGSSFWPLYDDFFNADTSRVNKSSSPTDTNTHIFALTVSIVEPKTIKEAMVDSAWIEAMQE
ncbi:hypothetical protein Tco_0607349, partial [Tanacetum coccineum]